MKRTEPLWVISSSELSNPSIFFAYGNRTAVFGFAIGYGEKEIAPFYRSLRSTSFAGDILLWCNEEDEVAELPRDYNSWQYLPMIPKEPIQVKNTHIDICVGRWRYYLDTLKHGLWDYVFISDVRDVVFQSNPLSNQDEGVNLAAEAMNIGQEQFNASWSIRGWGVYGLRRLAGHPILCSGAIWGDRFSLINYVEKLLLECSKIPDEWFPDREQAVSNYLVYSDQIEHSVIHPFGGCVWHVGLNKDWQSYIDLRRHLMYTKDGRLPVVVHQFDRHAEIKQAVYKHYGVEE